jgi:hypothetical protein
MDSSQSACDAAPRTRPHGLKATKGDDGLSLEGIMNLWGKSQTNLVKF